MLNLQCGPLLILCVLSLSAQATAGRSIVLPPLFANYDKGTNVNITTTRFDFGFSNQSPISQTVTVQPLSGSRNLAYFRGCAGSPDIYVEKQIDASLERSLTKKFVIGGKGSVSDPQDFQSYTLWTMCTSTECSYEWVVTPGFQPGNPLNYEKPRVPPPVGQTCNNTAKLDFLKVLITVAEDRGAITGRVNSRTEAAVAAGKQIDLLAAPLALEINGGRSF